MRTINFYKAIFILIWAAAGENLLSLHSQEFTNQVQSKLILPVAEVRSSSDFENWNWGVSLFTPKKLKNFSVQFKTGNLSASGGISRLNTPSLSTTVSAFSTAKTDVSVITASLPGIASYSKPVSYFAEAGFSSKTSVFSKSKVNCFYNPQSTYPVFSASQTLSPSKTVSITGALTAGYFTYEENTFYSWFTSSDYYFHEGKHFCMYPQLSVSFPYFNTLFSAACYESPFGDFQAAFRSENKIQIGRHSINLWAFYNENQNLISANQTVIKDMLQLKAGVQSVYPVFFGQKQPVFLKSGINLYSAIRLYDANCDEHKFKIAAGTKLSSSLYSFSLTGSANFTCDTTESKLQTDFDSASIQAAGSWYFKKITPNLTTAFSLSPSDNYSSFSFKEKISLNLSFYKNPRIYTSSAISFTQKDGDLSSKSFSQNITAVWKLKLLILTAKLGVKFE